MVGAKSRSIFKNLEADSRARPNSEFLSPEQGIVFPEQGKTGNSSRGEALDRM